MRDRTLTICAFILLLGGPFVTSLLAQNSTATGEKLEYVIYLSRHGVRSPTGGQEQYGKFSASAWPEWPVKPGYLTQHGYDLMKLFGAYDRLKLVGDGLLGLAGCEDATHVTILADSDQRTRETGKALAEGLMPGCGVETHALPEGTHDPLFHGMSAAERNLNPALVVASIRGRIGGDPNKIAEAFRPELTALDKILAGCGKVPATNTDRTSLLDISAVLQPGKGDHGAEFHGPLATASTLSENLLLEYTQGMGGTELGWGCLDEASLREAVDLHDAEEDYADRTPVVARIHASNLLDEIVKALKQSATGKPVAGAPGKPDDKVLLLVGHDTNIATVAGVLGLDWILDGRRNDTPPGGALVFELWRVVSRGDHRVRVFYTAQSLDQMREEQSLSLERPPLIAPLFVPACSRADFSCSLAEFVSAVGEAVNPAFVSDAPK